MVWRLFCARNSPSVFDSTLSMQPSASILVSQQFSVQLSVFSYCQLSPASASSFDYQHSVFVHHHIGYGDVAAG